MKIILQWTILIKSINSQCSGVIRINVIDWNDQWMLQSWYRFYIKSKRKYEQQCFSTISNSYWYPFLQMLYPIHNDTEKEMHSQTELDWQFVSIPKIRGNDHLSVLRLWLRKSNFCYIAILDQLFVQQSDRYYSWNEWTLRHVVMRFLKKTKRQDSQLLC